MYGPDIESGKNRPHALSTIETVSEVLRDRAGQGLIDWPSYSRPFTRKVLPYRSGLS
jgi:hypothetical protein